MEIKRVVGFSPAHNARKTLAQFLLDGTTSTISISDMRKNLLQRGIELEFLVINDGSTDGSEEILKEISAEKNWLHALSNEKNMGVARTLQTGYAAALASCKTSDDVIVRLDADLEHNPASIIDLIEKINARADGALHQLRYLEKDQTTLDNAFDYSQGVLQGYVLLGEGRALLHNCPGFAAYRAAAVKETLPVYEAYLQLYSQEFGIAPTWGGDIAFLFCASLLGYSVDTTSVSNSTRAPPNRTIDKILSQLERNTKHLQLIRKIKSGQVRLI